MHLATPRARAIVRSDAADALRDLLSQHIALYDAAAAMPDRRVLHGRISAYAVTVEGQSWLVRHYHRGGAIARVLGDRYARLGSDRSLHELLISAGARARGIATPAVIATVHYTSGVFSRFDIATEFIPGARDLAAVLFEDGAREGDPRINLVTQLIRRIVECGLMHPDLNLKNIIVSGSRAWVIDLDRCTLRDQPSVRDAQNMRDRFLRSLEKWQRKTGLTVPAAIRLKLEGAFGA